MEKQDLDLPKREPKLEVGESQEVQAYEDLRMELEQQMAEWLRGDQKEAHDMWMHYCHLTRDLSFNLCEQLRLILEPTLATKLKGDYKTGKRLNMRKIIPYIASQFKKDKIWLKRTKPAKRDYQIMISIDDSRSMNETHTVQMTLESLVMMTKALQQLEVGELSICSFGEQFRLLHPFEQQFADEQGAGVIQSFTFAQESTNVRLLMDQSLRILEESRQGNMWQLHMILSDGKCEDHEYILSQVRLAQEKNICMVFIILDKNNHLMNMSSVDYDFVDGKPKLKMTRYMDTFPFDYFVVVDHVDKLPGVLAETLRQFFSMVN
ncbi:hypothetical protein EDD86DRAFT_188131 [Gorgonomyces haynaldii]|nr:hypothetical protein EDD86DRAFT_188131 [Gorgonomyces haynaldii]